MSPANIGGRRRRRRRGSRPMAGDRSRPRRYVLEVIVFITATGDDVIRHAMPPPGRLPEAGRPMAKRTTDTPSQPSPSTTSSSRGWPTKRRLATTSTRSIARRGKRGRPQARSAPPTIESVRVDPRIQGAPRTPGRGRGTPCPRDNPRSAPTAPRSELTTTPERRLVVAFAGGTRGTSGTSEFSDSPESLQTPTDELALLRES